MRQESENNGMTFRLKMDRVRRVPMCGSLPADALEYLTERSQFVHFTDSCAIDAIAQFFIVCVGHVAVLESRPGGDFPVTYLGQGDCFDDVILRDHLKTRVLTYRALGQVEILSVSSADFGQIRRHLERQLQSVLARVRMYNSIQLGSFLAHDLHEARSVLAVDLHKCTGCDECVNACAESHDGITRLHFQGPVLNNILIANSCRSCDSSPCIPSCPVPFAIHRGIDFGEIVIEDHCTGCGLCTEACPFGAIALKERPEAGKKERTIAKVQKKAAACDLCGGDPLCVYRCPHDAARRVNGKTLLSLIVVPSA